MTGCPVENKVDGNPSREYPIAKWVKVVALKRGGEWK
jgi:hypothetical protein